MTPLRMLDYYKTLNSSELLNDGKYQYINSITQSEISEIIRTDLFINNNDKKRTFKRFVYSTEFNNNRFIANMLKYISISTDKESQISDIDNDIFFLYNIIVDSNENSSRKRYSAISSKINKLVLSHNDGIAEDSLLSLKTINNPYGFQTSISPALEINQTDEIFVADLYVKSTGLNSNVEYISNIFESSSNSNFSYHLDLKNNHPDDKNLNLLLSGDDIEASKSIIETLDLTNVNIEIRKKEDTLNDIPETKGYGIKVTAGTMDNSLSSLEKLTSIKIENYNNIMKTAEISDSSNSRKIYLNDSNYILEIDNINEYQPSAENIFGFGSAGSNIIYSEYANGNGILFDYEKNNNAIKISVDEIIER